MSKTVRTSPISPPPGQEDQSARLAASAQVDQVEGTQKPAKKSACSQFKQIAWMLVSSRVFWSLLPFNLLLLLIAKWQELLTWWAKGTPFSVVEDWADFLGFVFVYSLGNLVDGLRCFFQAVCS